MLEFIYYIFNKSRIIGILTKEFKSDEDESVYYSALRAKFGAQNVWRNEL